MGSAVLILAALGSPDPRTLKVSEAFSLAVHAGKILGVEPDGQRVVVSLAGARHSPYGPFQFWVAYSASGGTEDALFVFHKDSRLLSQFGIYPAKQPPGPFQRPQPRNDAKTQKILQGLGYGALLVPHGKSGWQAAHQGKPILGLRPSDSLAGFKGERLVSLSLIPVEPSTLAPPKISQSEAVRLAKESSTRRLKRFDAGFSSRAVQYLLHESRPDSLTWVWKVEFSGKDSTGAVSKDVHLIHGQTGRVIPQPLQEARWTGRPQGASYWRPEGVKPRVPFHLEKLIRRLESITPMKGGVESFFWSKTAMLATTKGQTIHLDANRRLVRFRDDSPQKLLLDSKRSLALSEALLKKEGIKTPLGRLAWVSGEGAKGPEVRYIQQALGYDYLEPNPLSLRFSSQGHLTAFDRLPPLPIPTRLPAKILSRSEADAKGLEWLKSRRTPQSGQLWSREEAKATRLGWAALAERKTVDLVWETEIIRVRRGDPQGSEKVTKIFLSAQTGAYLRAPDERRSLAYRVGSYFRSND